ncbi:glycosyltransferase family 39 protein [Chitinophaga silvatica]|nr:glycosyltransferase family 39 protein [Chitinophaga silvatica]
MLTKIVLQYWVVNSNYDLQRDEYLHLDMANHLAGGYISVPPFISWNSVLIQWLGNGIFWVRFFPAFYGALTMLLMWKMIEMAGGGIFAQLLAAFTFLFSGMTRLQIFYQPNSVDILSWTIVFWLLMKYIRQPKDTYLIWIGIVVGVGILNKYNIIFLVLGVVAGLLLTKYREVFTRRAFYAGVLLALIIISPNLVWQFRHGFPVIHHMKELSSSQLVNVSRIGFIIDQFIFFLGGAFLILAGLISLLFYKPFRAYRIVLIIFTITISLFVYFRAKSYYSLGLYPIIFAFGSTWWEQLFNRFRYGRVAWLVIIVLPFFLIFKAIFPVLTPEEIAREGEKYRMLGILKWEDGKDHEIPQDFADMLGWREMAELAQQAWEKIPENERKNALILCDNYGQAGALNYFNKGKTPPAVAMEADYVFWFPKTDSIHYVLRVGHAPDSGFLKLIGKIETIGKLATPYSRERDWQTEVYLLSDFSPEVKNKFRALLSKKQGNYAAY